MYCMEQVPVEFKDLIIERMLALLIIFMKLPGDQILRDIILLLIQDS